MSTKESKQLAFNNAWHGVIKQGGPCVGRVGGLSAACLYRGPGDTKCAVGHSIPDDQYKPGMECLGVYNLIHELKLDVDGIFTNGNYVFLSRLQDAHDNSTYTQTNRRVEGAEFIKEFKARMRDIAEQYELEVPNEPEGTH